MRRKAALVRQIFVSFLFLGRERERERERERDTKAEGELLNAAYFFHYLGLGRAPHGERSQGPGGLFPSACEDVDFYVSFLLPLV